MDQNAVGTWSAELVRKVEQLLRHSTGNVGEDEIGQGLIGAPQPLCERLQQ